MYIHWPQKGGTMWRQGHVNPAYPNILSMKVPETRSPSCFNNGVTCIQIPHQNPPPHWELLADVVDPNHGDIQMQGRKGVWWLTDWSMPIYCVWFHRSNHLPCKYELSVTLITDVSINATLTSKGARTYVYVTRVDNKPHNCCSRGVSIYHYRAIGYRYYCSILRTPSECRHCSRPLSFFWFCPADEVVSPNLSGYWNVRFWRLFQSDIQDCWTRLTIDEW